MRLSDKEFVALLDIKQELRGLEYKYPGPRTNTKLIAQVSRAIMAMANTRDGGLVVVGVDCAHGRFNVLGVSPDDLKTWSSDLVRDKVAHYADPPPQFDFEIRDIDGKSFVTFDVPEFADVPVVCRSDYEEAGKKVLRDGACYVRPRRKPESVEVPTHADMRDLLQLATEKSLRHHVGILVKSGLFQPAGALEARPTDDAKFSEQLSKMGI